MTSFGIRSGPAEDIRKPVPGVPVDSGRIYFRPAPCVTFSGQRRDWPESRFFAATGGRSPGEVRPDISSIN